MYNSVTRWLDISAEKYPDKPALVGEFSRYTFREVRERALSIAAHLRSKLSQRNKPIVVYMDKSPEMVIAFLGVAYSGCFYSPIDTEMPQSRVEKIFNTLSPAGIIIDQKYAHKFDINGQMLYEGENFVYQNISGDLADHEDIVQYSMETIDLDLLYVLFTSGSTGVPKGVGITHRAVIDFADWVAETFGITSEDSFGNQAPFFFDNSVLDIYSCIRNGSTLYIIPRKLFSQPVKLLEFLVDNCISTIFWVPSAMMMVSKLRALKEVDLRSTVRRVLFAGEVMPSRHLRMWKEYLPNAQYANLYGPTEITDIATYYIVDRDFADDEAIPIGNACRNMEVLVLNEKDELVSGQENGELCIRGSGVSVGYYNNPEKTKEVFVQNPLITSHRDIIYRSGDIVYYNERGEIIYVCRKDFQIKHMGHRIELGEIEKAAASLEIIDNCCCVYDDNKSRIVLFVESKNEEINKKMIQEKLVDMIPEYMLPGKVIRLETFPYNLNGKIDRVKLRQEYI